MMSSSQQSPQPTASRWERPVAFCVLVCLPLIVGAVRQISGPMRSSAESTSTAQPVATGDSDLEKCPPETTLFVSSVADTSLTSQADQSKASEETTKPQKESDTATDVVGSPAEQQPAEAERDTEDPNAGSEDTVSSNTEPDGDKSENTESQGSDDGESGTEDAADNGDSSESGSEDQTEQKAEDEEEIICCDANSEFEKWTVTLDETIQKAVANAITSQLESSTNNLDNAHAQLERLLVETELYKLQIEHLRNRLKEWQPVETEDDDKEEEEGNGDAKEESNAQEEQE